MKSKLGIALVWVFVFLLGGVAGAISHFLYRANMKVATTSMVPPPPKPGEVLDRMAREFNLDAQQKENLKAIFTQSREQYRALGQQFMPQWKAIRNETEEEIKQILRPDQRAKYEEFLKNFYSKQPSPPPSQPQK